MIIGHFCENSYWRQTLLDKMSSDDKCGHMYPKYKISVRFFIQRQIMEWKDVSSLFNQSRSGPYSSIYRDPIFSHELVLGNSGEKNLPFNTASVKHTQTPLTKQAV